MAGADKKPAADQTAQLALNCEQAAKALSISVPTLRNLSHTEGFPVIHIGDRKIYPVDGLRRWLDAQVPDPTA